MTTHNYNLDDITEAVQKHYSGIAERARESSVGCCGTSEVTFGEQPKERTDADKSGLYTLDELNGMANEAVAASEGCGNPIGLADVRIGETVLDLGSGGGIDCFLASNATGPTGKVIGIDMTLSMVELARENAAKMDTDNVVFKLGHIEAVPERDGSVDLVISNCVIALALDKGAVFAEIYRILRPGGRFVISDIVVEEALPDEVRASSDSWVECVGGAGLKEAYMKGIADAGFEDIEVLEDNPGGCCGDGTGTSDAQNVRSITVKAFKSSPAA